MSPMTIVSPLTPAEVASVRKQRAAAYELQEKLIESARIDEISMDELHERSQLINWPRWSRWTIGPCPPGCVTDHRPAEALDDQVAHEVVAASFPSGTPGGHVQVWWGFVDDLAEGTRSEPEVQVNGGDDGLSPQAARMLGDALWDAASAVEAWQRAQS